MGVAEEATLLLQSAPPAPSKVPVIKFIAPLLVPSLLIDSRFHFHFNNRENWMAPRVAIVALCFEWEPPDPSSIAASIRSDPIAFRGPIIFNTLFFVGCNYNDCRGNNWGGCLIGWEQE